MNARSLPIRMRLRLLIGLLSVASLLLNACGPAFKMADLNSQNGVAADADVLDQKTSENADGRSYTSASKDGELQKLQAELAATSTKSMDGSKSIDWLNVEKLDASGNLTQGPAEQLRLKLNFVAASRQEPLQFIAKLKKDVSSGTVEILPAVASSNGKAQISGHCLDADCMQFVLILQSSDSPVGMIYRDRAISIRSKAVIGLEDQTKINSITAKIRDAYATTQAERLLSLEVTNADTNTVTRFQLPLNRAEICVSGDLVSTSIGDQALQPFCGSAAASNLDIELIGNAADGNLLMAVRSGRASVYIAGDTLDTNAGPRAQGEAEPDYFAPEISSAEANASDKETTTIIAPSSHATTAAAAGTDNSSAARGHVAQVIAPSPTPIEKPSDPADILLAPMKQQDPILSLPIQTQPLHQLQAPQFKLQPLDTTPKPVAAQAKSEITQQSDAQSQAAMPTAVAKPLPLAFKPPELDLPKGPLSNLSLAPIEETAAKETAAPADAPAEVKNSEAAQNHPEQDAEQNPEKNNVEPIVVTGPQAVPMDLNNPITRGLAEGRERAEVKAAIQKWAKRAILGDYFRGLRANFSELSPIMQANHIPNESLFITAIESAFFYKDNYPILPSSEGALGPWQLMMGTAKVYGITPLKAWAHYQISPKTGRPVLVDSHYEKCDMRTDMVTSTKAAAQYIRYLYNYFPGNPKLAIMGYNLGERGAQRAMERLRDIKNVGVNFWGAVHYGMAGSDYVLDFLGVYFVGLEPQKYGITIRDSSTIPKAPHVKACN